MADAVSMWILQVNYVPLAPHFEPQQMTRQNTPDRTRRCFLTTLLSGVTAGCIGPLDRVMGGSVPTEFDQPRYANSYAPTGTWPQPDYDAARSGFTPASTIPRSAVGGAWLRTIAPGDHGTTPPVIDGERLYVGHPTAIVAYNPKTGAEEWQTSLTVDFIRGITLASEYIIIGTALEDRETVSLRAFDRDTGTEAWSQSMPDALTGGPTVVDDTLLVATREPDATVYAFQPDGTPTWQTPLSITPYTPVSADPDGVFVTAADGTLVALDLRDGHKRWASSITQPYEGDSPPIQGTPALDADHLYAPGIDATLYAIDRTDGSKAWTTALMENDYGNALPSPAVTESTVYASSHHGGLIALATSDGHERWRAPTGGLQAPAATHDGVISVQSETLAAYTSTGEERWRFEMQRGDAPASAGYVMDPSIAVAHGMVYVSLSDSRIYGIGGS